MSMSDEERRVVDGVLLSTDWSLGEKRLLEWRKGMCGGFVQSLFDCLGRADDDNLLRLAKGFPSEVAAWRRWAQGDLGQRWRAMGINIDF